MDYDKTVNFLNLLTSVRPKIGIVLGSGMSNVFSDVWDIDISIPYGVIPNFVKPTVSGHGGTLVFGYIDGVPVVIMQGRFHYYEGYSMDEVTYPIRVFKLLGVETLITTNATGGINDSYNVGDIMLVRDHINLMGTNPLMGANKSRFGVRFPDINAAYDAELIDAAHRYADVENISAHVGVLAALSGPTYETNAEYNFLKTIGCDAVGMSTIPEIIVARHCDLRCCAVSLITNHYKNKGTNTHEEVTAQSVNSMHHILKLITHLIKTVA